MSASLAKISDFLYIDTPEALAKLKHDLSGEKVLAIDLECENNLHHFGTYLSLVQISSSQGDFIIDVLKLRSIPTKLFTDQNIEKIFHDVSFDLRILKYQFDCSPKNIFDTQLAALFLNKPNLGLGSLLEEYFGFKKQSKYQRFDWTRRPLNQDMLSYAVSDVKYLVRLKDKLTAELKKRGRLSWVEEECRLLEKVDFVYQEQEYLGVSGVKILPPLERGRFHALFDARNQLAEKLDRPPFMIISNKQLLDFAHSPLTLSQWRSLSRVHPEVRREANFFFSAVQSAKPEPLPERERKSFSPKQKDQIKALTEKRNCLAEKIQVKPHLLLSTEQIRQIILTGQGWKDWQKDVFNK